MPDKKQQPPKKKPIVVSDENDPKYKAYQDSLKTYNFGNRKIKEYNEAVKKGKLKGTPLKLIEISDNSTPYPNTNIFPIEGKFASPTGTSFGSDKDDYTLWTSYSRFKKPEQEVILQEKKKAETKPSNTKKSTQPIILEEQQRVKQTPVSTIPLDIKPINSDLQIQTTELTPMARIPKSYKVETSGGGKFGGWTRTEEVTDFNNISLDAGTKRTITPQYALGGNIQQTNNMNNITTYNEGGLHETNPNGGIPMGTSPQGEMNTVEEGEARMGDMIYSDRIPLSQEAVEAVGLPRKFVGKTPGQIMSLIDKTFKGRNDSPSQNTKKDIADKVAQAQEMIKAQQQAMQTQSQEVPDMMNGEIPEGMEQFTQNQMFLGGGLDLINTVQGNTSSDPTTATLSGLQSGVELGSMLGPVGMGAGALIGGTMGLIGGFKAKKAAQEAAINKIKADGSQFTSDFKMGGKMYDRGGRMLQQEYSINPNLNGDRSVNLLKPTNTIPQVGAVNNPSISPEQANPYVFSSSQNRSFENDKPIITNFKGVDTSVKQPILVNQAVVNHPKKSLNKVDWEEIGKQANKAYPHALRVAPVAMNLAELARLKKNGYDKVNPIGNDTRFNPEYIDEKSLVNLANSEMNNSVNAISQMGGSQGAVRNALLATGLNRNKGLSQAMIDAQARNIATDQFGQQFNNQNTEANIARRVMAEDLTARNKGAYETNRSKLVSQLGTDIGSIGKEEVFKDIAENMTGYDWLGNYLKINPTATKEQVIKAYEAEQKAKKNPFQAKSTVDTSPIFGAYGGKMKFKKY